MAERLREGSGPNSFDLLSAKDHVICCLPFISFSTTSRNLAACAKR